MARITALGESVAAFTVEFDAKLYFRVEILRVESGSALEPTAYFADVYQLRFPHGLAPNPSMTGVHRVRPFLHFLEDFKPVYGDTIAAVRNDVFRRLTEYAEAYLKECPQTPHWRQFGY